MEEDSNPITPTRSNLAIAGTTIGILVMGALVGEGLAWWLAPNSALAKSVGFMCLPMVMGVGYRLWKVQVTVAVLAGSWKKGFLPALWKVLAKGEKPAPEQVPPRDKAAWMNEAIRRGMSFFVMAGVGIGTVAGILMAVAAPSGSALLGFSMCMAMSVVYGATLTRLARSGYLPILTLLDHNPE